MNKCRRKSIKEITDKIKALMSQLEDIKDEEDEARENIPENLENSDVYKTSENCSDTIEDVISDIGGAINSILEIL